jgi:TonB-linked SusC/RagA family outer membrane protein
MEKNSLFRQYCHKKTHIKQLFRIMKITFILFFLSIGTLFADNMYSQKAKVTINERNVMLETVLNEIEKQTDYLFIYSKQYVDVNRRVSLKFRNKPVKEILADVFEGTDIAYMLEGAHIILSKKDTDSHAPAPSPAQAQIRITGVVTDESGEPLPGATIEVKGASRGTVTGADGAYNIQVPDQSSVLVYSYIGYISEELAVGNRTFINVTLKEDVFFMDEVVVVGYGTQSRRKTVSSISTIAPEKVENLPSSSIVNNLGGRTPGIIVTSSGGGPTKKSSISIRGGEQPLVVIDGFVSEWFDFENLNPQDIENISILKDASAVAIYGARAGNGILLITTKKGDNQDLTINYDYSYSLSQPTVMPKKLGSFERLSYMNQAYINDGLTPQYSSEVLEKYRTGSDPYNYPNTDWQELALKDFAPEQRHNLSINGGNKKNNYYASMSYFDQGTIFAYDTNWYKAYTFRLNVTNSFDKIGLKTTVGINGIMNESRMPWSQYADGYYGYWGHIQNRAPWELAYTDRGLYAGGGDHPLVELDPRSGYRIPVKTAVNGMFIAEWNVPKADGLRLKASGDYRFENYRFKGWRETAPQATGLGTTELKQQSPPVLQEENNNMTGYTMNYLAYYDRNLFDDFTLSATAGYEYNYSKKYTMSASRENYQINFDQWIAGPSENMKNSGKEEEWGRASFLGRLKVDYKNKYLLEGSLRYDGSDWFPEGKRWGTFFSFSGGWTVSEESFMEPLRTNNIINTLKLRGSYGVVGLDGASANLDRFAYIPGYSMNNQGYVVNGNYVPVFHEGNLISSDITWYTQNSSNIGFDFTSLNEKLYGGFDYYYMRTVGYLASLSGSIYTDPLGTNLPKIKSDGSFRRSGFDFSLGYKNNIGELYYDAGVNFTYFDQLWENNPDEDIATLKNPYKRTTHKKGYLRIGYLNDGFYRDREDIATSPRLLGSSNLSPGDIKYKDLNGDGFIDGDDRTYIGKNSFPRGNYGINLDLKYRGWFMYCLFQGATARDYYMGDQLRSQWGVLYPFQEDFWTPGNRNAVYPRITSNPDFNGRNNYQDSDFWIVNTGYFRLKSLQLGYDFKPVILKNVKWISTAKLTLSGTNLLTFSKAMDYYFDPEAGGDAGNYNNYDYPTQRVYSITTSIGF